ncbi:hypothetical protein OH764_36030 (plasmid) [Burkholderia sp. M6-3]
MADNTHIQWKLANQRGIWIYGPDKWAPGHDDHPSEPWHAGRMNDVLALDDGSLTGAADAGGVWRIASTGVMAIPVGNQWGFSRFRCLAAGPNAADGTHIYAGGTALFETDLASPLPLITWREIVSLSNQFPTIGMIYRIAVLKASRIIALATDQGVLWARIPALLSGPGDGYVWRKAKTPGIPDGGYYSIAPGPVQRGQANRDRPLQSVIVSGLAGGVADFDRFTGPHGLFFGEWEDPLTLVLRPAAVINQGADARLIQAVFGLVPVASCDADLPRAYAVAAFDPSAGDRVLGVLRTDDGGRSWNVLDSRVEDLSSHYSLQDSGQKQTNYNTCLAVSPRDPDLVMIGYNSPLISFNAGLTWWLPGFSRNKKDDGTFEVLPYNLHVHEDQHGMRFFNGPQVLNGHFARDARLAHAASDGGLIEIEWGYGAWVIATDIRSNGNNPDLLAVVLEGNNLEVYVRKSADMAKGWLDFGAITTRATGPGCIIQSNFQSVDDTNNYEVVVLEGSDLVHYWGYLQDGKLVWNRAGVITSSATGPGCIIQSSFGAGDGDDDDHGNFEVVVLEGTELAHYSKDNSDVNNAWGKAGVITTRAVAPGCIIQADFPFDQDEPNFEVVVLEDRGLVHYYRDNSGSPWPWKGGWVIDADATGPASFFQSDYRASDDDHGNFELIVPEGHELVAWYKDNSGGLGWVRIGPVTHAGHTATGPGCFFQSNYGGGSSGNFELLACEDGEIVHAWRNNARDDKPWLRGQTVTRKAYTFRSEFNRFLATLENEKQAAVVPNSEGYGTMGVCSAVSGLVAGGLQDNGVVYGHADAVGSFSGTPWNNSEGGDGFGSAFLPGRTPDGRTLSTGTSFICFNNDGSVGVRAFFWRVGKMNPHKLQSVKGNENVIPLGTLNPNLAPPPPREGGLVSPRMEPVLAPRFDQNGLLCVVGASGADVYGLFVQGVEARFPQDEEPRLPMRWDFLGRIPAWDSAITSITVTALSSASGSRVFVAADATFPDHVETRIFSLDNPSGIFTDLPLSKKIFNITVNAMVALGDREVFGVTAGGSVIHWPVRSITSADTWELLPGGSWTAPLTTITADPTTTSPTLFVGATGDVHVSVDHGKTWQPTRLGLPKTFQVSDLRWVDDGAGKRLYLSTYGRSTWVAEKPESGWG